MIRRLWMSQRTDTAVLDHAHKPPVTVTIVEQDHGVAFGRIRLSLDGSDKGVQGIYKVKINIL